ncbi:MAG: hypothetical protein LC114_06605 [Bryobacterales bacterium]|nr:hypothetical protein [Bryobacterales bacterium]
MSKSGIADRIAKERNVQPELVRAIATDVLRALDEVSFKQGLTPAIVECYWEVGNEAAYHLGGLLAESAELEPGEVSENFARLDPSLSRFRTVRDRWTQEMERRE